MKRIHIPLTAAAAFFAAGPALAHDCAGQIDEFEQVLDEAAEEAIAASSGGQAVAGAREAQAMDESGEQLEEPVVPFQEAREEAEAVEEADEAGDGGAQIIEARTALQDARQMAEDGDETACRDALHEVQLELFRN